jgi:ferritin-like metal-binding protein YciE
MPKETDRGPADARHARVLLIRRLGEMRAIERAAAQHLRAQLGVVPAGSYRALLERHLEQTHRQEEAIARCLPERGARARLTGAATKVTQSLTALTAELGRLPADIVRGGVGAERLLRSAERGCALEAVEIAAYDAIETLARVAGDEAAARLAAEHRGQEERMLADLRKQIAALTEHAVRARAGGQPVYEVEHVGGVQRLREGVAEGREAAREAAREVTDAVSELAEQAPGLGRALVREKDLAIPDYASLNANQVISRLGELSRTELRRIAAYERRHRNRRSVLERIEADTGKQPWPGYDEMPTEAILARLDGADEATVELARDYERRHRARAEVIEHTRTEPALA